MSVQRIAGRYAKSLIDLAQENSKLERVLEDVTSFKNASANRDFYLLMKSPIVKPSKKQSILDALFKDKYDELTMAFLNILVKKGREAYLPEIADAFIAQYKEIKQISTVKVTTAKPMDAATLKSLEAKLAASDATYSQVEIETEVDPELIGGFVLEIGGKIYDASVVQKLEDLKRTLAS
ncbi:MAG: ATP synthase F1 subunit delta [Bacteroidota bacterium]